MNINAHRVEELTKMLLIFESRTKYWIKENYNFWEKGRGRGKVTRDIIEILYKALRVEGVRGELKKVVSSWMGSF